MRLPADTSGRNDLIAHPFVQVVCGVVALIFARVDLMLMETAIERLNGNDFGKFYYALHAWLAGGSLYAPTVATRIVSAGTPQDFLNMNPPHFHLVLIPLAALPIRSAVYLWSLVNLISAVVAVVLVCRQLGWRPHVSLILPACVGALACAATGATVFTGQYVGLMLIPMVLAWRASQEGREIAAGAWLGLALSLKPFLGLFLPVWLMRREYRSAASAICVLVLTFGLGLLVFGLSAHREWVTAMSDVSWSWVEMNGSIEAVLARALIPSPGFKVVLESPALVRPLWLAGAFIVAIGTVMVGRRSVDHAYVLAPLGALLISPLGWVYYLWLALPGMAGLWRRKVPVLVVVALIGLLVPFFIALQLGGESPLATVTVGSVYTWVTLVLWIAALRTPDGGLAGYRKPEFERSTADGMPPRDTGI